MKNELPSPTDQLPVPVELIERRIYLIRGQKVMLDSDLADLYQVPTKAAMLSVGNGQFRRARNGLFYVIEQPCVLLMSSVVRPICDDFLDCSGRVVLTAPVSESAVSGRRTL